MARVTRIERVTTTISSSIRVKPWTPFALIETGKPFSLFISPTPGRRWVGGGPEIAINGPACVDTLVLTGIKRLQRWEDF
jgi:hypothetical protein